MNEDHLEYEPIPKWRWKLWTTASKLRPFNWVGSLLALSGHERPFPVSKPVDQEAELYDSGMPESAARAS